MPTTEVIHVVRFVQYTGSNSAEMVSYVGGAIQSEVSGVLRIRDATSAVMFFVFNTGDYWNITNGSLMRQADFDQQYVTKAATLADNDTVYDPTALTARVAAAEAAIAAKQAGTMDGVSIAVPLLLLGGTADRAVVWNRPFPDATYKVSFLPDANTIGKITPVVKAGTKTATGLTVTISAGLALTVAGVLHVLGTT